MVLYLLTVIFRRFMEQETDNDFPLVKKSSIDINTTKQYKKYDYL